MIREKTKVRVISFHLRIFTIFWVVFLKTKSVMQIDLPNFTMNTISINDDKVIIRWDFGRLEEITTTYRQIGSKLYLKNWRKSTCQTRHSVMNSIIPLGLSIKIQITTNS